MRLCKSYTQSILSNGKNLIKISGEFALTHIYLFIELGANSDLNTKHGISHLCEHIFLKAIDDIYSRKIEDSNFNYIGYTEYEYTIFKYTISNTKNHIECFLNILDHQIIYCNVAKHIDYCKHEIINECIDRKKETKKSLKVNSFLTDDIVDYVPIGVQEEINKLRVEDLEAHISLYPSYANIVIFGNYHINDITEQHFKYPYYKQEASKNILYSNKLLFNNVSKDRILYLEQQPNSEIKIYFPQKRIKFTKKEIVIKYLLEIILNYRICFLEDNNISCSFKEKIISEIHIFTLICLKGYCKTFLDDIELKVYSIVSPQINKMELETAKKILVGYLNELKIVNENYYYNGLIKYLIHGGLLTITQEQINYLRNVINSLNLNEINLEKNKIYNDSYKIVVSL